MRTLVVGAGGVGGYFGGRLLHAGRDVTFLVSENRARQLQESGLSIRSALGDVHLPNPPTVRAASLGQTFDLVLAITGPGMVPYLENGTLITAEEFSRLREQFGAAGFMMFAVWFN